MKAFILALLFSQAKAWGESCTYAVERLKQGPADFEKVIKRGRPFEDETFNGRDLIYWWGFTDSS